jgi:hypothetical protein
MHFLQSPVFRLVPLFGELFGFSLFESSDIAASPRFDLSQPAAKDWKLLARASRCRVPTVSQNPSPEN